MHPPFPTSLRALRSILYALFLVGSQNATAQYEIDSNGFFDGDFQGKDAVHTWSLELTEPFNDFRLSVDSPTGDVWVALIPVGANATRLAAEKNKGKNFNRGIMGMSIEATQAMGKIPKGRYTVQIKPFRPRSNIGAYRLKLVEPKLGDQSPAEPPTATPVPAAVPEDDTLAQLLAEIKSLREAVKKLESDVQSLKTDSGKSGGPVKPE